MKFSVFSLNKFSVFSVQFEQVFSFQFSAPNPQAAGGIASGAAAPD